MKLRFLMPTDVPLADPDVALIESLRTEMLKRPGLPQRLSNRIRRALQPSPTCFTAGYAHRRPVLRSLLRQWFNVGRPCTDHSGT